MVQLEHRLFKRLNLLVLPLAIDEKRVQLGDKVVADGVQVFEAGVLSVDDLITVFVRILIKELLVDVVE